MKLIIGSALALLLMGGAAYAQEPDKDKPKDEPKKEEEKKREPKKEDRARQENEKRDEHAKPQESRTQEERNREQMKAQQDRAKEEERARQTQQHTDRDNHNNLAVEHRGGGRRIPEEKFRVSFGRAHHFHVRHDERRFSYGGYWFTYSDPWPVEWIDDDDVYIEEVDGEYYLYNVRHPGIRVLVIVAD